MTAAPQVLPTSLPTSTVELDRLRLPMPDAPFAECGGGCTPLLPRPRPTQDDEHAMSLYRWVLGHHLVFCVWRLMCDYLPQTGSEDALAELYNAYTALLLYSGSCTEEVYATVIRSRMAACHPGFSGTWARDHERAHELLRRAWPAADSKVKRAVKFNRLVHMAVAKRLVPSGGSLRRESGNQGSATTDAERNLLDWFFLTERALVCRHGFADQLTRRIILALTDLATHPVSVRYGREEIDRFQVGLAGYLETLSRFAAMAPSVGGRDYTANTH
jgi:L-tyrosine peroxygenase